MAGVEAGPPTTVKPSLYRRLRLAVALWRARRATADGRFPRRALRRALSDAGPDEVLFLAQLAESQATLSAMTDDTGLLREAVDARRAADRAPDDPLPRIMVLSAVAELLARAGSELDDPELFEEVVELIGNSLAAGGGSLPQPAQAHRMRYEHDGDRDARARSLAFARVVRVPNSPSWWALCAVVAMYRFG
jgi:hypothetical protein